MAEGQWFRGNGVGGTGDDEAVINDIQRAGDLRTYLIDRQNKAVVTLEAISDHDFLADPAAAVERVYATFDLRELVVENRDKVTSHGVRPQKITTSNFGESYDVPGQVVTLSIPTSGPTQLWGLTASSYYSSATYRFVRLGKGEFVFSYSGASVTPEQVETALGESIQQLQQTAAWINHDVAAWRPGLRSNLEAIAGQRRKNLEGIADLEAALAIPVHPAAQAQQLPLPVVRKPL